MKKMLFVLLLMIASSAFAFDIDNTCRDSQNPRDVYGCGTDEFEFERFDDATMMMAINRDARIACDPSGLCRLSSVTSNDRRFTATFTVGQGNQFGQFGGQGTNIIIPGSGGYGCQSCNEPYYGITLRYTSGRCTQTVNVPRAVYYAVNRYMYGLLTEEGGTRRGFTPADEAMIMFYTTIMKQATGCVAGQ